MYIFFSQKTRKKVFGLNKRISECWNEMLKKIDIFCNCECNKRRFFKLKRKLKTKIKTDES